MVKSGLDVNPEQKKEIRVSPYRLATHLSLAITTYGLLLWTGYINHSSIANITN
jgi:cytochrome c oxidase assembly protein subunit 15